MTTFSDLLFLFRFLPVFLLVYYLVPTRFRNLLLFLGSLGFYASFDLLYAGGFLILIILNYLLSVPVKSKGKKAFFIFAVLLDCSVLVLVKSLEIFSAGFLLPLGVSFFIFKMISFQAELYLGRIPEKPGFWDTCAYFSLFFQIPEGPIMRYSEGGFDRERRVSLSEVDRALCIFAAGLGMKVLLADRFALLWNELYRTGYESISTPLAWIGVIICSFRLYFDFWGYSLMASSLGMMLGFPFIRNFEHPYAAASVSEYYRRWHMTLGFFLRDFVYIPLGGSREGRGKTVRNLFLVWLITAVWHGTSPNFLIWGGVLFLLIIWEKFVLSRNKTVLGIFGRFHVIILIPLTWLVFSITNTTDLQSFLCRLFPFFGIGKTLDPFDWKLVLSAGWYLFPIAFCLCIPKLADFFARRLSSIFVRLILLAVFWVSIYFVVISGSNPFLYYSF